MVSYLTADRDAGSRLKLSKSLSALIRGSPLESASPQPVRPLPALTGRVGVWGSPHGFAGRPPQSASWVSRRGGVAAG